MTDMHIMMAEHLPARREKSGKISYLAAISDHDISVEFRQETGAFTLCV